MRFKMVTLAQRPDLIGAMYTMPHSWPEFMLHDPIADIYFGKLATTFPEYQLVALDEAGW